MMETVTLQNGCFYHIYNRGNNKENIFVEEDNYIYFLSLLKRYILPIADIYTYCLLKNHFHLLVRIKDDFSTSAHLSFANLFNAYAKAINKKYNRTGKLFNERFKRRKVNDDAYFTALIFYIRANPQLHNFISDFRDYRHSSYKIILSDKPTDLKREEVLHWFGNREMFEKYHRDNYPDIEKYVISEEL